MVTTAAPRTAARPTARTGRVAPLLIAGGAVVAAATTVIALVARSTGAPTFPALMPLVYLPFAILGFAAAAAGWAIIRRRAGNPRRVLSILVPVLTVLSFVPDTVLALTGFIPGTTSTGVAALMLMHLVVVAVAVPVLLRALPLRVPSSR